MVLFAQAVGWAGSGTVPRSEPTCLWMHFGLPGKFRLQTHTDFYKANSVRGHLIANTIWCYKMSEGDRLQHALACGGVVVSWKVRKKTLAELMGGGSQRL